MIRISLCTLRLLLRRLGLDLAYFAWFRRALGHHWALCSDGHRVIWQWFIDAGTADSMASVMAWKIVEREDRHA